MKLKFCNKFWYVILDSFILSKGLKQLIVQFLWHRGACCVLAVYSMNPLYQLGNSPLLSSLQMRTSPAQLSWREAVFRRKHLLESCVKINEHLVNGETLRKQETPLLRTAVCPISTVCRNPLQTCSPAGAGVRAGQERWLLTEAGGISQHISSGLSSSLQQPLCAPLLCSGFSVTTE